MIGLLAKLAKAAQLAKQAEAAIDVASNRIDGKKPEKKGDDGETKEETPASETASKPEPEPAKKKPVDNTPAEYRAVMEAGAKDARLLLTAEDARTITGKRVKATILAAHDEYLICDYACKDRAGTTLGLNVSATLTWEHFDAEIPKKQIFEGVGDAAFRGSRQIYVKAGDVVFWIHTAGEVTIKMALEAANLVVRRLGEMESDHSLN